MRKKPYILQILIVLLIFAAPLGHVAQAAEPVVRAILFFSPTCPHCHKVINEDLPPLVDEYGDQLQILGVNVATPEGQEFYQGFVDQWQIPAERAGVPTLVVGDVVLVGEAEIPQQFPSIIEQGLQNGGIDWPDITGVKDVVAQAYASSNVSAEMSSEEQSFADRFKQDPTGNSLSVVVLLGMVASVISIAISFKRPPTGDKWSWVIPILSIVGLIVAGYLSYVEVTQSKAVCGPVGDCNTVQQSPYARLFGVLPIGVLGLLGYITILVGWAFQKYGPEKWNEYAALTVWGLALFGVLFSIYLTFLEPFIIGATCAWCITSAVVITLQLWAATEPAKQAWQARA